MSNFIADLKARVQQLEAAVAQSLANHNALLGSLSEIRYVLSMATDVADVLDPNLGTALKTAQTVVNEVDSVLTPAPAVVDSSSASS